LRWTDPRANGSRVKLRLVAKPTARCSTNLYVHHWGHRDICSIAQDGVIAFSEGAEEVRVQHHDDGFLEVTITFINQHDTISIGTGKPRGQYAGTGTDQYIFKSIEIELRPINEVRQMLVERLWRGNDPFRAFPSNLFEHDLQGWGSQHPYLSEALELLRPSVIVEVGVWKGASTIFMAEAAKRLGLSSVIIAVDTWLGSSEHWLRPQHFAHLPFFGGYPALYYKFLSNVAREGLCDYVLPIPVASIGAAEILSRLEVTADVIHLDAAHDYDSVIGDLRAWWPVLAPGGLLIGDDYRLSGDWQNVRKAFDDFFQPLGIPIENARGKCRLRKPG
jgi:hypothetical protein